MIVVCLKIFEVFVRVGTESSDLGLGSYECSNESSGSTKGWEFFSLGETIGFSSSLMDRLGYGNLYMDVAELAYFRWWFYVPKVKTAETRVSYCLPHYRLPLHELKVQQVMSLVVMSNGFLPWTRMRIFPRVFSSMRILSSALARKYGMHIIYRSIYLSVREVVLWLQAFLTLSICDMMGRGKCKHLSVLCNVET